LISLIIAPLAVLSPTLYFPSNLPLLFLWLLINFIYCSLIAEDSEKDALAVFSNGFCLFLLGNPPSILLFPKSEPKFDFWLLPVAGLCGKSSQSAASSQQPSSSSPPLLLLAAAALSSSSCWSSVAACRPSRWGAAPVPKFNESCSFCFCHLRYLLSFEELQALYESWL